MRRQYPVGGRFTALTSNSDQGFFFSSCHLRRPIVIFTAPVHRINCRENLYNVGAMLVQRIWCRDNPWRIKYCVFSNRTFIRTPFSWSSIIAFIFSQSLDLLRMQWCIWTINKNNNNVAKVHFARSKNSVQNKLEMRLLFLKNVLK